MNFPHISFRFTIWILSISILFTSCHSYYVIPKDDYNKIETMENIKIVYKSGKEFVFERNDTAHAKVIGDSLIVDRGIEKKLIQMSDVEKIKENRFDLGGTITVIIIPLIILVAYFFANFSPGG